MVLMYSLIPKTFVYCYDIMFRWGKKMNNNYVGYNRVGV